MSEDEASLIGRGAAIPDHCQHKHWNKAKAIRALNAGQVRGATLNGVDVVVILQSNEQSNEEENKAYEWRPRNSGAWQGCRVWQVEYKSPEGKN